MVAISRKTLLTLLTAAFALGVFAIVMSPVRGWASDYTGDIDTSWYSPSASEFELKNAAQLAGLADLVNEQKQTFEGKTVYLASDIDLSAANWVPIGSPYNSDAFKGTFDGQGHVIANMTIKCEKEGQALFARINNATVGNFTITGEVQARGASAGAVAHAEQSSLHDITSYVNLTATGSKQTWGVDGSYNGHAAGVVYYSTCMTSGHFITYSNLVNYGQVRGTAAEGVAGVVGFLVAVEGSTYRLERCGNYGQIMVSVAKNVKDGSDAVGGVLACTATVGTYQLVNCFNAGQISATNLGSAAGVAGHVGGTGSVVENCFNVGEVLNLGTDIDAPTDATPSAAGIVSYFNCTDGRVSNNYSTGAISAASGHSAGIIAISDGPLENIAFNNYYLEGSSTGAFNDRQTGQSFNQMIHGSSATQSQLKELIDPNGGVKALDLSNYQLVQIEEEDPFATEAGTASQSPTIAIAIALALLLCVLGAVAESRLFSRGLSARSPKKTARIANPKEVTHAQ